MRVEAHHLGLLAAYAAVVLAWWWWRVAARRGALYPAVWRRGESLRFDRPWAETGLALLGAVGVIAVGQLWVRGWMLPEQGWFEWTLGSVNQVLIFAPILLVPLLRRQGSETVLLPRGGVVGRLAAGLLFSVFAAVAYATVRSGEVLGPVEILANVWRFSHLDEAVQVLLEEVAVGILLVRLAAALGPRVATVSVAALFALGHLPALLAEGAGSGEIAGLAADFALVLVVVGTVLRSGDLLWLWPTHTLLDLTQYAYVSGSGA